MLLVIAFYGTLVALSLWATWHDLHLRTVGAMLTISFCASNAAWFTGDAGTRAGIYTMLEILVSVSAFLAFSFSEYKGERWFMRGIVAVSVLSICVNIAFASILTPINHQIYLYDIATNICFAAECLLATTAGLFNGVGVGRFDHWPWYRRVVAQPDVRVRPRAEP